MPNAELTTMVMIQNPISGEVLVQHRLLSWKGPAFPGGHAEENESMYACAVREIKEETGLAISGLIPCGLVQWCHEESQSRYMVFLYKTTQYSGALLPETEEGRNEWMPMDKLIPLAEQNQENSFRYYMPLFSGEQREFFGLWRGDTRTPNYF